MGQAKNSEKWGGVHCGQMSQGVFANFVYFVNVSFNRILLKCQTLNSENDLFSEVLFLFFAKAHLTAVKGRSCLDYWPFLPLKDVRANCSCASLLRTQIHVAIAHVIHRARARRKICRQI